MVQSRSVSGEFGRIPEAVVGYRSGPQGRPSERALLQAIITRFLDESGLGSLNRNIMNEKTSKRYENFRNIDLNNLWHPFTQQKVWSSFDEPLVIERGEGAYLIDVDGRRFLDGVSSLWCNVHGHSNPRIVDALKAQAENLCHSTLLGLSHVPILEATERLFRFTPGNLKRAFYADSGSTAVEAGLRMAIEWWQKQNTKSARKRKKFASIFGGYHGDTLGAVGVGYLESFHGNLESVVVQAERVPPPHWFRFYKGMREDDALDASIAALRELFDRESDSIAALIMEPIVQGAAGMWIHPIEFLRIAAELCREYGVLLIIDEVATGFGKTGKMFAVEHAGVEPDIMILGKGLSGGYLPISAALASDEIFQGFVGDPEEGKTFYYGQTFAGNPMAACAAKASLDLFLEGDILHKVEERIEHLHKEMDALLTPLRHVDEVRSFGLMVGVELTKEEDKHRSYPANELVGWKIAKRARELGLIIRPLGNIMVLMPALTMEKQDLTNLVGLTAEAIQSVLGE